MTPPPRYGEGSSPTALRRSKKFPEPPGTYDALFHAVCPQRPDMPRPEGPPQVPPAAVARKTAPIRPVYDDFETAFSSITSRSVNSRPRNSLKRSPKVHRDVLIQDLPIPRRTQTFGSQMGNSQFDRSAENPTAVRQSFRRELSDIDLDISGFKFSSTRPPQLQFTADHSPKHEIQKQSSPSRFFGSIRKALGSRPAQRVNPMKRRSLLSRKNSSKVKNGSQQTCHQPQEDGDNTYSACQHALEMGDVQETTTESIISSDEMAIHSQNQRANLNPAPVFSDRSLNVFDDTYQRTIKATSTASQSTGALSDILDSAGYLSPAASARHDSIVKSYAPNDRLWDVNLDTDDGNSEDDFADFHRAKIPSQFSSGNIPRQESYSTRDAQYNAGKKQYGPTFTEEPRTFKLKGSSGRAPSVALPQLPSTTNHWTVQSSSEALCQSSSYGDTQNLLGSVQRAAVVTPSVGSNIKSTEPALVGDLYSDSDLFERSLASDHSSMPLADANHPPHALDLQILRLEQHSECSVENPPITPRLAHEREVSAALRRMGAFSNPSQDTPVRGQGDGGIQSSTDSTGLLSFINKQGPRTPEIGSATNQGFYHESAIHQTWLDSHQFERIRVPINHSVSSSLSTSQSGLAAIGKIEHEGVGGMDEDGKDWETIFESGITSQPTANAQETICRVKRAGSSLANNSDEGINNPVLYQHSDFSSTDRIIQHPAQIEFSHDYRYREIKEGNLPVLLPSYKQPTVSGFPVDSYRSVSTFQNVSQGVEFQAPMPLSRSHTNPFRSSPPELLNVMSSHNHSDDLDIFVNGGRRPDLTKYSTSVHTDDTDSNNNATEFRDSRSPNGPGNFFHTRSAATASGRSLLEAHSHTLTAGSSIADASIASLDLFDEQPVRNTHGRDGSSLLMNAREHGIRPQSILQKQPASPRGTPGALYREICSEANSRQGRLSMNGRAGSRYGQKGTSLFYPTNQIRALSLVETQRAQERAVACEDPSEGIGQGNFFYRSPLAPVKSKSWRYLYTKDQLSNIRDAAIADGVYDLESLSQQSSRPADDDGVRTNGTWKRLSWRPQMFAWPRENSSMQSELSSKKTLLSSIIFASCCLFLPLLVLYGTGYMDSVMLWITNGKITTFGKLHKKVALQVGWMSIAAILIFITVFVAMKATAT